MKLSLKRKDPVSEKDQELSKDAAEKHHRIPSKKPTKVDETTLKDIVELKKQFRLLQKSINDKERKNNN